MINRVEVVMLIDDNRLTNSLNERTLLETDMIDEIIMADSAEDALEQLRLRKDNNLKLPDLIFLDIIMPRMSGWEFLDTYREMFGEIAARSVIMLTSSPDVSHLLECTVRPEVNDFVIKPLTDVECKRILQQHVQLSRYQ
jgi:CheY-like chemotaxis protein